MAIQIDYQITKTVHERWTFAIDSHKMGNIIGSINEFLLSFSFHRSYSYVDTIGVETFGFVVRVKEKHQNCAIKLIGVNNYEEVLPSLEKIEKLNPHFNVILFKGYFILKAKQLDQKWITVIKNVLDETGPLLIMLPF